MPQTPPLRQSQHPRGRPALASETRPDYRLAPWPQTARAPDFNLAPAMKRLGPASEGVKAALAME